jgi:hypothetical protein
MFEAAMPRISIRGVSFEGHLDCCSARALYRGKIVPANASAFNKSRLGAVMIIIAAANRMRREASLRGGSRAEGSSDQHGNTR